MACETSPTLSSAHGHREPYLKMLYVTPERIVKSLVTRQMLGVLYENEMLARFIVDEAHCISSWGHDFRKDYGQLSLLKTEFPQIPIVALTATSRREVHHIPYLFLSPSLKVSLDTLKILGMAGPSCKIFTGGFDRPNLKFEVCQKPSSQGALSSPPPLSLSLSLSQIAIS
jgi:superfamily II DNA helicase RecQ